MNTLLKVAVYTLVFRPRFKNEPNLFFEKMTNEIAWVLLSNSLTASTINGNCWNFSRDSNGKTAWCQFPTPEVLKELEVKNISKELEFHIPKDFKKQLIYDVGISQFEDYNKDHPFLEEIREGMVIEDCFSECLKQVRDDFKTYEELEVFQMAGFVYLAKRVYRRTQILMDQKWFYQNVVDALYNTYSEEIADHATLSLIMPEKIDEKIRNFDFYDGNERIERFYDNWVRLVEHRLSRSWI